MALTKITSRILDSSEVTILGTIATGVWEGTAIADDHIASAATWNTASTDRLKWDGGATGLTASTGRTSLGLVIGTDVLAQRTFNDTNWDNAYTYSQVGHLPLAGGTLTGALIGTSATFSGALSVTNGRINLNGNASDSKAIMSLGDATYPTATIGAFNTGGTVLIAGQSGTGMTIGTTGAATFSSSVTAQGFQMNGTGGYGVLARADGINSAANGAYIGFVNNAFNRYFISQLDTNNDINYYYYNGSSWSSSLMKFSNTGAATFSSSVTANGMTLLNSGGTYLNYYVSTYLIGRIGNVDTNDMYYDSTFGGNHYFRTGTGGTTSPTTKFTIASSGAATFSSSVTAGTSILVSNTINAYAYQNFGANSGYGWQIGKADNSGGIAPLNSFYIYDLTNNATRLTISSTGAATFSSSITSTYGYFSSTGFGSFNSQITLNNTTSSPALITFQNTVNGHAFGFTSTGTPRFTFINGGLSEIASITQTGAATFSSSVTAEEIFIGTTAGFLTLGASTSYGRIGSGGGGVTMYLNGASRGGGGYAASNTAVLALDGQFAITNSSVSTTKFRVETNGNVLIGTSTDGGVKLDVRGSSPQARIGILGGGYVEFTDNQVAAKTSAGAASDLYLNVSGGNLFLNRDSGGVRISGTTDNGAYNLQCNGTGVWGAGAYVNGSDARLKEDIKPILSGIDYINKMNPVSFKYLESYSKDRTIQTGFIAQELKEVFKDEEWVEGIVKKGNKHYNVAYQNIIPILVKAIQEQQAIIEDLKSRIETLEI